MDRKEKYFSRRDAKIAKDKIRIFHTFSAFPAPLRGLFGDYSGSIYQANTNKLSQFFSSERILFESGTQELMK